MMIDPVAVIETPTGSADPIHSDAAGWWFWDETWADRHGPYPDEATARKALDRYCLEVLG